MTTAKKATFEQAMQQLEHIVAELERGELPLDEALKSFEKGMGLVQGCQKELEEAELKVEKIMLDGQKLRTEELETEN